MVNKGHFMIKTLGVVAGDEQSYDVFKDLFDPVVEARFSGYGKAKTHPVGLDVSKLESPAMNVQFLSF